ncbi:class I SAM-dependent methyltransferase [Kitasatospora sp. NPDC094015]|uniref:O-methyltransferase n=1 Tax=Kitasatospora sp. NPDC094015 TaxID=3155205 RepID=UPI00332401F5
MAQQVAATEELLRYVREVSLRDDPLLAELRRETAELPAGEAMQVMAEEGQLLALLVGLTGARSVLEIGTFTGYSTLCLARALPPGGSVVTCDITDRWPAIGAEYWKRAQVADLIEVRIGDALDTLAELAAQRGPDTFDLVFVDADKANYPSYYEAVLPLVRPGGLIVVDNTLYFGRVVDPAAQDRDTVAVRELNAALHADERVEISLLAVADGITLVRKRP